MIRTSRPVSIATVLPSQDEFAAAFFAEAVRHLGDARILHKQDRFAGSIASSMKGAEFAVKTAFLLEGGLGFIEKELFRSHKPLTDVANHPLFKRIHVLFDASRLTLKGEIMQLEGLTPKAFGEGKFDVKVEETNTEYPYLERQTDPAGYTITHLVSPQFRFTAADSKQNYQVAREVILLVQGHYTSRLRHAVRVPVAI